MKPIQYSLLISLCLHMVVLIIAAFVLCQPLSKEFADNLMIEVFSVQKQRQQPLKKRIEPPADRIQRKVRETPFRFRPDPPGARIPLHTQKIAVNPLYRPLKTAQMYLHAPADLSTAVREIQDTKVLLQAEATRSAGVGKRGLHSLLVTGVRQLHRRTSILSTVAVPVDGAAEPKLSDWIDVLLREKTEFAWVMPELALEIVRGAKGRPIDVLFVIDVSGSMENNIGLVTRHLSDMINIYQATRVDYALGFTAFFSINNVNKFKIFPLTKQMDKYQWEIRELRSVPTSHNGQNGQNPLDAINQTVREVDFRPTSRKNLILVTDDLLTSTEGITLDDILTFCRESAIHVYVLGLNTTPQQRLAAETGGSWHPVPEEKSSSVQ